MESALDWAGAGPRPSQGAAEGTGSRKSGAEASPALGRARGEGLAEEESSVVPWEDASLHPRSESGSP